MPVNYSDIITIYKSISSDFTKISADKNADVEILSNYHENDVIIFYIGL